MTIGDKSLRAHRRLRGKIAVSAKAKIRSFGDLSVYYTPGVGAVSSHLARHKKETRDFTMKRNAVAIVSDGSAVLGLGNLGPEGAIPVMEGKAMIFKEFAGIDAIPIVLNTQDADEIVRTVENISPIFGGINLEDISAPRCFGIEKRLESSLDIPVMHDDQHGTAMVVLAGLISAFKVAGKNLKRAKIAVLGAGAAGTAIAKLLLRHGVHDIVVLDSRGILGPKRKNLIAYKKEIVRLTNKTRIEGGLNEALLGRDAVIGVSQAGILKPGHVKAMADKPIIFAMANPVPEIMPDVAKRAGAYVVATGRSDFPNQINNALVFPGVFRGAMDNKVRKITDEMKIKAAVRLAAVVKNPSVNRIIPPIFDKQVVKAVASAIK